MFDSVTENPELIWNDATRNKVKGVIDKATEDLYKQQVNNPEYKWNTVGFGFPLSSSFFKAQFNYDAVQA